MEKSKTPQGTIQFIHAHSTLGEAGRFEPPHCAWSWYLCACLLNTGLIKVLQIPESRRLIEMKLSIMEVMWPQAKVSLISLNKHILKIFIHRAFFSNNAKSNWVVFANESRVRLTSRLAYKKSTSESFFWNLWVNLQICPHVFPAVRAFCTGAVTREYLRWAFASVVLMKGRCMRFMNEAALCGLLRPNGTVLRKVWALLMFWTWDQTGQSDSIKLIAGHSAQFQSQKMSWTGRVWAVSQ